MNTPVTLYLVEDHQIVIDGLKLLFGNETAWQIIGTASNVETARREIPLKKPQLALIDIRMPHEQEGLDLILGLRKTTPDTHYIVLSMHAEQHYMRDALNGGASAYLLKSDDKEKLRHCLETVLKGERYFPHLLPQRENRKSVFTPREAQILKLIVEKEYSTREIADLLSLAEHTVNTHRKSICRKTNASTPLGFHKFLKENHIEL
ncbi:response regulator [Taibaiella helva]|uniref:response regulator n=1 Tax=Taibaiella helva TaxID=2301235 RepID=UPI000E57E1A3|nr:response regulator transcription factor [Taibaiella helva]